MVDALSGAVVAAYNVAFSVPFLEDELERVGVRLQPPRLGLMFLRPALGLGARCSLEDGLRRRHASTARESAARAPTPRRAPTSTASIST